MLSKMPSHRFMLCIYNMHTNGNEKCDNILLQLRLKREERKLKEKGRIRNSPQQFIKYSTFVIDVVFVCSKIMKNVNKRESCIRVD